MRLCFGEKERAVQPVSLQSGTGNPDNLICIATSQQGGAMENKRSLSHPAHSAGETVHTFSPFHHFLVLTLKTTMLTFK